MDAYRGAKENPCSSRPTSLRINLARRSAFTGPDLTQRKEKQCQTHVQTQIASAKTAPAATTAIAEPAIAELIANAPQKKTADAPAALTNN